MLLMLLVHLSGECWSGKNVEDTMKKDGATDRCVAEKFEKCPFNSFHCVGQDHANAIYKLVECKFSILS